MPTYQYACTECGHQLDAVQSFADDPLTECPTCAGRLRKLFSSVGIVFKGSGFYRNDSRAGANGSEKAAGADKGTDKTSGSDKGADQSSPSAGSSSGGGSTASGSTASGSTTSGSGSSAKGSSAKGSSTKGSSSAEGSSSTRAPAATPA